MSQRWFVVDGSNCAHRMRVDADDKFTLEECALTIIAHIQSWASLEDCQVDIVFDGGRIHARKRKLDSQVHLHYSHGRDGDEIVAKCVKDAEQNAYQVVIVTDDRVLSEIASSMVEYVVGSRTFLQDIGITNNVESSGDQQGGTNNSPDATSSAASHIRDLADDDVVSRLERMRRGL